MFQSHHHLITQWGPCHQLLIFPLARLFSALPSCIYSINYLCFSSLSSFIWITKIPCLSMRETSWHWNVFQSSLKVKRTEFGYFQNLIQLLWMLCVESGGKQVGWFRLRSSWQLRRRTQRVWYCQVLAGDNRCRHSCWNVGFKNVGHFGSTLRKALICALSLFTDLMEYI